jgi:TonB family protein
MARVVTACRTALVLTTALCWIPDDAWAAAAQAVSQSSGRQIQAADGDTVVVENDDRISVVRQRVARVRVVANEEQNTLILLADWAPSGSTDPDGRVNRTWRFTGVEGRWPFDMRWEGLVTLRFPDGPFMGPGPATATVPVLTLETSAGTVAFVNGALRSDPPGVDIPLRFGGMSGGGRDGASFDQAEQEALSPNFMPSFSTMSINGTGGGFVASGAGIGLESAAGSPPITWTPAMPGSAARFRGMPAVVHRVEAEWPRAARDAGVSGVVLLQVAVASDGTVRDAQVLRSIPMLDAAAVAAVRQWRFQAAGPDGRPDPLTITVPVIIPASRH